MPETIAGVLHQAAQKLFPYTNVPQLEAEILLAYVLGQPRSYLFSRSKDFVLAESQNLFWALIHRRLQGEPVAYLIGHKEFWSLDLEVTKDVLIPRPETELLVELILEKNTSESLKLVDLGTGSGAIALALAHERPLWEIYATDQSGAALNVACRNAKRLAIQNVGFLQGEWLAALSIMLFDVIVSNPPYLALDDPHLDQGYLHFEPISALISGKDGLDAIREIILSARRYLKKEGYLFLEHGYQQGEEVRRLFLAAGYTNVETRLDLAGLERVTFAKV